MRLLVTRAEPDATALKERLVAKRHSVLIEPLLRIAFQPLDDVDLDGAQALIATSRNGVRALAQGRALDAAQAIPIFTVGPGTAATAQSLGFQQVIEGPRDAGALIALIALRAEVNAGPLVYLAGEVQAADVAGELRHLGFHVLEPIVYTTALADRFGAATVGELQAERIDGVLLFSPQTARTYARLILAHGLSRRIARTMHFCLSTAVARGLDALPPLQISIAARPNVEEMVALIDHVAPQSP